MAGERCLWWPKKQLRWWDYWSSKNMKKACCYEAIATVLVAVGQGNDCWNRRGCQRWQITTNHRRWVYGLDFKFRLHAWLMVRTCMWLRWWLPSQGEVTCGVRDSRRWLVTTIDGRWCHVDGQKLKKCRWLVERIEDYLFCLSKL